MHSFHHLYEKLISIENIERSIKEASLHKRNRYSTKKYYKDEKIVDGSVEKIIKYVTNFHNFPHKPIEIYDGVSRKKRKIIVPKFKEQIIHHMLGNVLRECFEPKMYEWSMASIPGKGSHKAKRKIEKWIREDTRNVKYCLKIDIRKFFDSIPPDILIAKLKKEIHDKKFIKVLEELISVTGTGKGIPLGFYTSQWLANWYLTDLDHYIKEKLGAKHYVRYMDDMVIFRPKKRILHEYRKIIDEYLQTHLGLRLKDNWQVFRFDYIDKKGKRKGRCLDFMGFQFYRNKTIMRKSIMIKCSRKAKKMSKKERKTIYDVRQILSYLGWIDCTNSYNMYLKYVKPHVKFGDCKKKVSKHDKKESKRKKAEKLIGALSKVA